MIGRKLYKVEKGKILWMCGRQARWAPTPGGNFRVKNWLINTTTSKWLVREIRRAKHRRLQYHAHLCFPLRKTSAERNHQMKGMMRAGTLCMYARYSAATVGSCVIRSSYKINRLYAICIYKYVMLTSMGILKANAAAVMPSPTSGAWDQNITEKSACWISTKLSRHQNYLNLTRDLAEATTYEYIG